MRKEKQTRIPFLFHFIAFNNEIWKKCYKNNSALKWSSLKLILNVNFKEMWPLILTVKISYYSITRYFEHSRFNLSNLTQDILHLDQILQ